MPKILLDLNKKQDLIVRVLSAKKDITKKEAIYLLIEKGELQ